MTNIKWQNGENILYGWLLLLNQLRIAHYLGSLLHYNLGRSQAKWGKAYLEVVEYENFVTDGFHGLYRYIEIQYQFLDILDMDPKSAAVLNEVIGKLQDLLGGKTSGSSGPREATIPEFDINFAKCIEKSKTLSPQIQALTDIYGLAAKYMKQILGWSSSNKKYSQQQEEKLKQKFMDLSKKTEDIQKKNAEYIDHCRAIRELLSVTFWVFVPTPEFLIKGAIESAEFNALKFQKKKNLDINDWYKLLHISIKSLEKYVLEGYPMGISFGGSNDSWGAIIDGNTSASTEPAKQQAPKQVQAPKAPVAQAKKAKKKEMIGINLNISNYEGENIDIKAGELEMKHGIFIQNCKGVVLKIDPKIKSIVINKCQDFTLFVNTCVSGVQIMNSSNITLLVHEKTPSISIDSSNSIKITLNEQNLACDIVTSKTSQLTVSQEKLDGTETKAFTIAEQLITKWNATKNKFQTTIYDKFL